MLYNTFAEQIVNPQQFTHLARLSHCVLQMFRHTAHLMSELLHVAVCRHEGVMCFAGHLHHRGSEGFWMPNQAKLMPLDTQWEVVLHRQTHDLTDAVDDMRRGRQVVQGLTSELSILLKLCP